jgi:hypothetical protein
MLIDDSKAMVLKTLWKTIIDYAFLHNSKPTPVPQWSGLRVVYDASSEPHS